MARGSHTPAPVFNCSSQSAERAPAGRCYEPNTTTAASPAGLQRLLEDVRSGKIDLIVVYKVDRLTRSLADFAKLVELLDEHNVSFVSVTQQFNTTTSMGRLTLNVMLSFAQFERENTSERIRDKISGFKRKGLWVGGMVRSATTPTNEGSPSTSLRRTGWLPQLSQAWQPQPTDGRRANRASSPRFAR